MEIFKPFGSRSFAIGVGIAALTYLLSPTIKRNAKGVAVKGMQGALMAGETASHLIENGKDKISGVFQQGNDLKNEMYEQMINEWKSEREQYNHILQDLMNTVKDLKSEISGLKDQTSEKA